MRTSGEGIQTVAVIPAYNEATSILGMLREVSAYVDAVIVVDDGSKDKTYEIAKSVDGVYALRHRVNLGKGAALKTGCEAACQLGAEIIVLLDADRQHHPHDIPRFIHEIETKHVDVVFGSRKIGKDMPIVPLVGNKFLSLATSFLFGIYISDTQSGFRAFRVAVYPSLRWMSTQYAVETEMIVNVGKRHLKHCEIEIETVYLDKYKGTTMLDGLKIFFQMLMWKFL